MENTPTSSPTMNESIPNKKPGSFLRIIAIVVILLLAGGAIWYFFQKSPQAADARVVAVVNGEEITRTELDQQKELIASQLGDPAQTPSDEEVLSQMVEEALVFQEIEKRGIDVDTQFDEQFNQVKSQVGSDEEFAKALAENNVTEEEFKENFKKQLKLQEYIEIVKSEQNITVTPEEVQSFYDESVAGQADVPSLDEVRPQVEQQITQQKIGAAMLQAVESLREKADIQILL